MYGNRIVSLDPYQQYLNHHLQLHPSFDFGNELLINLNLKKSGKFCSGICHHMIFNKTIINELINLIETKHNEIFWKFFLKKIDTRNQDYIKHCEPSEYDLYYNYVTTFHSNKIKIRPISWMEQEASPNSQNPIVKSYEFVFEQIKSKALSNNNSYIAFHSYNRDLFN